MRVSLLSTSLHISQYIYELSSMYLNGYAVHSELLNAHMLLQVAHIIVVKDFIQPLFSYKGLPLPLLPSLSEGPHAFWKSFTPDFMAHLF